MSSNNKLVQTPNDPTTELINSLNYLEKQNTAYSVGTTSSDIGTLNGGRITLDPYVVIDIQNDKKIKVKASNHKDALKKAINYLNNNSNLKEEHIYTFHVHSLENGEEGENESVLYQLYRTNNRKGIINHVKEMN